MQKLTPTTAWMQFNLFVYELSLILSFGSFVLSLHLALLDLSLSIVFSNQPPLSRSSHLSLSLSLLYPTQ